MIKKKTCFLMSIDKIAGHLRGIIPGFFFFVLGFFLTVNFNLSLLLQAVFFPVLFLTLQQGFMMHRIKIKQM